MRIALAGTGELGLHLFEALCNSTHEIVAVIQNGRRRAKGSVLANWLMGLLLVHEPSVERLARRRRFPIIRIDRMDETELTPLRRLNIDLILVGGFDVILKKPLLELPRIACVNCHSSLLPKHRGPNPFSAVVLSGESETGVTFHVMEETIDTGPIIAQYSLPLRSADTALSVYQSTAALAGKRVVEVVDGIARAGVQGVPQNPAIASYDPRLRHEDLQIRWELPAIEIDRLLRACRAFFTPHFVFRNRLVHVRHAVCDFAPCNGRPGSIIRVRPNVRVATGEGSVEILDAYYPGVMAWPWPPFWDRLRPGDRME